jgi:hypothetical protein
MAIKRFLAVSNVNPRPFRRTKDGVGAITGATGQTEVTVA